MNTSKRMSVEAVVTWLNAHGIPAERNGNWIEYVHGWLIHIVDTAKAARASFFECVASLPGRAIACYCEPRGAITITARHFDAMLAGAPFTAVELLQRGNRGGAIEVDVAAQLRGPARHLLAPGEERPLAYYPSVPIRSFLLAAFAHRLFAGGPRRVTCRFVPQPLPDYVPPEERVVNRLVDWAAIRDRDCVPEALDQLDRYGVIGVASSLGETHAGRPARR